VREQRQRLAVSLAIAVALGVLEQQFREESLPAGHGMQAGADPLAFPIAFPKRPAVARPVDRAERDSSKRDPDPNPERYASAVRIAGRIALELV
jgi:hypothetical protein